MQQKTEVPEFNITDMMHVTKRLHTILKEESALINEMKLGQLQQFHEEKVKLTSVMEGYKDILKHNPAIIRSIPKPTMDEIRKINEDFEETLNNEYQKQFMKAQKVHTIIMDALKKVLEDHSNKNSGYNKHGLIDQGKKKILLTPPVSISESF
jgi:hypothetical protein